MPQHLALGMPESGLICRKCRSGLSEEGEHWCKLCSSASALSELGRTRFSYPTHRALAEEVVFQAVRQVRAIVEVDKQTHSQVTSLSDKLEHSNRRLREVTVHIDRSAQPKRQPSRPQETEAVKAEIKEKDTRDQAEEPDFGSEESEEESEEEEGPRASEAPVAPEAPPPPPPPAEEVRRPVSPPELPRRRRPQEHRERSRSRHRGRRGGRKHAQHHRGLDDPDSIFKDPPKKKKKKKNRHHEGDGSRPHRRHQ